MGLFMGASLITVFELVVYIVVKLHSLTGKQRQTNKRDERVDEATGRSPSTTSMYANSVYIWIILTSREGTGINCMGDRVIVWFDNALCLHI